MYICVFLIFCIFNYLHKFTRADHRAEDDTVHRRRGAVNTIIIPNNSRRGGLASSSWIGVTRAE